MTTQQAITFIRTRFPDAKVQRWLKGRWIVVNAMGSCFGYFGRLTGYVRPERAWKQTALRIKRREK